MLLLEIKTKKLETTRFGETVAIITFHLEKLFCKSVIQFCKSVSCVIDGVTLPNMRTRISMCLLRNKPKKYVMGVFCRRIRECPQACRHENFLGGVQPLLALSFGFWFGKNDVHCILLKSRDLRWVLVRTHAQPTASSGPHACATYGKFCERAATTKIGKGCSLLFNSVWLVG